MSIAEVPVHLALGSIALFNPDTDSILILILALVMIVRLLEPSSLVLAVVYSKIDAYATYTAEQCT
jgi:hypothetical protein